MSGREWQPGDVALVTVAHQDGPLVMLRDETGWTDREATFYWDKAQEGWEILEARPLLLIDPEDREQVERLVSAFDREFDGKPRDEVTDSDLHDAQTALRSLVTPPKPDEPQGLGAVVEDAGGKCWVRIGTTGFDDWRRAGWTDYSKPGDWHLYQNIAVVKVLSEGWSA